MSNEERVGVVIVAAGASRRFGKDKLFLPLAGKPLLTYSLAAFEDCAEVQEIVLVMSTANLVLGQRLASNYEKVRRVCQGGVQRRDSVVAGLRHLSNCSLVLVHDGARPLVTKEIIAAGIEAGRMRGACVPGVPVKDTIKTIDEHSTVITTLERTMLRAIQTPQVFDYPLLVRAYELAGEREFTDDGAVVEAMGHEVHVYPGSYENIKVTTSEDMELAEAILRRRRSV